MIVFCKTCNKEFEKSNSEIKKSPNHFCCRSCAAKYNNTIHPKRNKKGSCKLCGTPINLAYIYCKTCSSENICNKVKKLSDAKTDRTRRKILIKLRGHQCEYCKNTEWNGKPITLELDHIDGNSDNNEATNLQIICPNCHSQTPFYKGANRGNSKRQQIRRQRYAEGKTY